MRADHIGAIEAHALGGERVEVRRHNVLVPAAADVRIAMIVRADEPDEGL
jgi:hypothetical protein